MGFRVCAQKGQQSSVQRAFAGSAALAPTYLQNTIQGMRHDIQNLMDIDNQVAAAAAAAAVFCVVIYSEAAAAAARGASSGTVAGINAAVAATAYTGVVAS